MLNDWTKIALVTTPQVCACVRVCTRVCHYTVATHDAQLQNQENVSNTQHEPILINTTKSMPVDVFSQYQHYDLGFIQDLLVVVVGGGTVDLNGKYSFD